MVPDKGKGKDAKKGAAAPTPAPVPVAAPLTNESMDRDNFSVLGEDQRREEQVELLRDRKTLDLESTILRTRKNKQDEFTKKYAVFLPWSTFDCFICSILFSIPLFF